MAQLRKIIDACFTALVPQLNDIRIAALKESSFRFYRGRCDLFAKDIAELCKDKPKVTSWICGDLHFENFGSYKGENRLVYFDLNDFDECMLAWPELEVARFLTSIIIGARELEVPLVRLKPMLSKITSAYEATLVKGKALMMEKEVARGEFKEYFDQISTVNRKRFIDERTWNDDGRLRLKTDGKRYIKMNKRYRAAVYEGLQPLLKKERFKNMEFRDVAFRIAGTGSLGLERYCVLCYHKKKKQYFLVDVKEARKSRYKPTVQQPKFKSEAARIREVGSMMQFNAPAYATTLEIDGKWYLVKELQPKEDRMDIADFKGKLKLLTEVAAEMAVLMAYAHIRSSGHTKASNADELKVFAESAGWQKSVIKLSMELAARNDRYYNEFIAANK